MECPFCAYALDQNCWVAYTDEIFVIKDKYPATDGHLLLIPYRHVSDYFDLTRQEQCEMNNLFDLCATILKKQYPGITGFNIGTNIGLSAGQSVDHCHVHMIPRRDGDVANPKGGVRGCVPEKMSYE